MSREVSLHVKLAVGWCPQFMGRHFQYTISQPQIGEELLLKVQKGLVSNVARLFIGSGHTEHFHLGEVVDSSDVRK